MADLLGEKTEADEDVASMLSEAEQALQAKFNKDSKVIRRVRRLFEDNRWMQHLVPAGDPGTDG